MIERKKIRVLLADDHIMVREGLSQILEDSDRICVVEQVSSGKEVLEVLTTKQPDIVVLDYRMPGLDAPYVIKHICAEYPSVKVLILTIHANIHYAVRVLECGAHGYVIKSAAVQELVEAIEAVDRGEVYLSADVSQNILQHLRKPKRDRIGLDSLSTREFELLRSLGSGMGLKQCADHLNISTSTASTYRSRLMEKLNLGNTAEIIRFALENDIVE